MEFLAGFPFLSNYLGHWLHWGGGDVFAQPFIFLRKWKIVQFKMWCVCANVSKPLLFFHFLWLLWLKISQYHTISYKNCINLFSYKILLCADSLAFSQSDILRPTETHCCYERCSASQAKPMLTCKIPNPLKYPLWGMSARFHVVNCVQTECMTWPDMVSTILQFNFSLDLLTGIIWTSKRLFGDGSVHSFLYHWRRTRLTV